MKFTFVLLFGLAFSEFVTAIDHYSATYDNVDVDAILNSKRLFNQYIDCILSNGPCTADGRNLRRVLPEAMATNCKKCTAKQRQIARKISLHLKEKKPDIWVTFLEKFDPEEKHITDFEEFLAQEEEILFR